ncbi:MAG: methionyl-tRNA formyltransferase [Luminiphilus sp.]|nr:methionyl-tRNA formyltransferase [Luminiphilus sp.]
MTTPLKVVFAGTPDFAARHLEGLIDGPHQVVSVISQPDRPAGRGKRLQHSPVKTVALDEGLPVWQPETLKTAESEVILTRFDCDILIVVAYGLILPAAILPIPRLGCLNVHASLLPRWRGAAPVQRAIEAGDTETGVSVMAMEPGLDTGPVLLTRTLPIQPHHTSGALLNDLAEIGVTALAASLDQIDTLLAAALSQHHDEATYAHKIDKTEAALDWSGDAADLARRIRAFCPAPGCYTHLQSDRFKVLSAYAKAQSHNGRTGEILSADETGLQVGCGDGILVIKEAQLPGAKAQPIATLLNGHRERLQPGQLFNAVTGA